MVKKILCLSLFVGFLGLFPFPQAAGTDSSLEELVGQIQVSFQNNNIQRYLGFFNPDIREDEEKRINSMFDDLKMEQVTVQKVYSQAFDGNKARLYLRVLYENSYSAIIELWRLNLVIKDGRWQIDNKDVAGDVQAMYKVSIPSERIERADRVEIVHTDIQIGFREATVFYDNLPNRETALLVIGDGDLRFSPSVPREQHQLELIYDSPVLNDDLNYVYIRCSNYFFTRNIKITKSEGAVAPVLQSERNRAYSLFVKHYSRSFTIENSLSGQLLSFMPQGDEAVFEFEGQKIGNYTYIYSPFAEEEINFYQWEGDRIVSLYSPQVYDDKKQMFISIGQKFDITDYRVEINYRPSDNFFSGRAKINVESEIGTFDVLKFKFNPELQILRIDDEKKHQLYYNWDKLRQTLYVYLPPVPRKYNRTSIELYYRGQLEPNTSLVDVVYGPQLEETIVLIPPRYETYLYTQSSYWYPAPADDDYFTANVRITVPPEYSVVSNGVMVKQYELKGLESVADVEKVGSIVSVFETSQPVKYLAFIVGRINKIDEDTDPLPLQYYKAYDIRGQKWDYLEEAKRILSFYQERFGAYPFDNFTIVHRLWPRTGGHSPPSFIVLNDMPRIPQGYRQSISSSPVDLSRWKEYFLAHEIAHQWWGQGITWRTYRDQWLSEGLAQFASILYLKEKHGERAFSSILKKFSKWTEKMTKWGAITMGSRISYFDFEAFQSIIYDKTSLVLNMLKDYLGEGLFFRALREFFKQKKFSPAGTNEFIKIFERVSGKELEMFFSPWFDSYLLPEVHVSQSVHKSGKEYQINLNFVQATKTFVFPLWVEWKEGGNERREKVIIERRVQDFSFKALSKPKRFVINPDDAVPGVFR
ncbi:MAG: M1 family aminopeptidase [Candidatus Aminicenantes bacterium]|jgi:hypothetical protein